MPKVLIVEDDEVIARGMAAHLAEGGFEPVWVTKGQTGLARLRYEQPDVCVLDLMLPGIDGWQLLESARRDGIGTPIVSARGSESDRIRALELGADDYLVKPFSMAELVARVRVAARRGTRAEGPDRGGAVVIEELRIDPDSVQAFVDGRSAELTATEFRLLLALARERGRVLTRDELMQRLWGRRQTPRDRTVDVFVRKLREKVDRRSSRHTFIQTRYGVGYSSSRWRRRGRTRRRRPAPRPASVAGASPRRERAWQPRGERRGGSTRPSTHREPAPGPTPSQRCSQARPRRRKRRGDRGAGAPIVRAGGGYRRGRFGVDPETPRAPGFRARVRTTSRQAARTRTVPRARIAVPSGVLLAVAVLLAALGAGERDGALSNWQALVLGVVQGLTELLPISSSGHLILVPWLADWRYLEEHDQFNQTFDVALHLGTLVAVASYFRQDVVAYTRAWARSVRRRSVETAEERLSWAIALATVPAALVGAFADDFIVNRLGEPWQIAILLAVFAVLLWVADRTPERRSLEGLDLRSGFAIGAAQMLALAPGVSRSGVTITAARFLGLDRDAAARFSFLLLIPITFGAVLYKGLTDVVFGDLPPGSAGPFLTGMLAAAASGLVAIVALLGYVRRHDYSLFVLYRLAAAAAVFLLIAAGVRDSAF
ncbi:MAG: undecaprenyl-diphosphate phosphatase [Gaiellaceae bacterium]